MENRKNLPPRISRQAIVILLILFFLIAYAVYIIKSSGFNIGVIWHSLPALINFIDRSMPIKYEVIYKTINPLLETIEYSFSGAILGITVGFVSSLITSKNKIFSGKINILGSLFLTSLRSIPDLIWGLIFVILFGIGPLSAIFAIAFYTGGFAGKFFSEALEDHNGKSQNWARVYGFNSITIVIFFLIPDIVPKLISITIFMFEKSFRAMLVMGLIGAGGLGIELKIAVDMLRYQELFAVITEIFFILFILDRLNAKFRSKLLIN